MTVAVSKFSFGVICLCLLRILWTLIFQLFLILSVSYIRLLCDLNRDEERMSSAETCWNFGKILMIEFWPVESVDI